MDTVTFMDEEWCQISSSAGCGVYANNITPVSLYNDLCTHYKAQWHHHFICSLLPNAPRASNYYSVLHLRNWGSEKTFSRCHNDWAVNLNSKSSFHFHIYITVHIILHLLSNEDSAKVHFWKQTRWELSVWWSIYHLPI